MLNVGLKPQVSDILQENYPLLTDVNASLKGSEQTTQKNSIQNLQHRQIPAIWTKMFDSVNVASISIPSETTRQTAIDGNDRKRISDVIGLLSAASEENWDSLCKKYSWITHYHTSPPDELFPGNAILNYHFRSLQYRIAAEVEPDFAPKILEIWDKETKPYEPRESYLISRLMLATQALRYNQVPLSPQKLIEYLQFIVETIENHKDVGREYFNTFGNINVNEFGNSNYYSFLFSFIYVRPDINPVFLNDLFDALDQLESRIRLLLLADLEEYNIDCRILIESIYLHEEKQEKPDYSKCLKIYDKVIEKSLGWGYPHIAALSARSIAIIQDEYLDDPNSAHKTYDEFKQSVATLPIIEEGQAFVYLRQGYYQEALNIYERILPDWHKSTERFRVGPLEEYCRAAKCAANLDDWKMAATLFAEGAKRTEQIEKTNRYIGAYADAGFAYFKAGNMMECIKYLHLALLKFEGLPADNTDIQYFTLKKRIEHTIKWINTIWYKPENNSSKLFEPNVGFCSDQVTKEEILDLPDCPIGYSWLHLSQIEYRFGHEITVFEYTLKNVDRDYPILNFFHLLLETQYDFRNRSLDNLPQRIYQLILAFLTMRTHLKSGMGALEKSTHSITNFALNDFSSIEITIPLILGGLMVSSQDKSDTQELLANWCSNSSDIPIKGSLVNVLGDIESIFLCDYDEVLIVMKTQEEKVSKRLAASLSLMFDDKTSLEDLFLAHLFISNCFIDIPWEELVIKDLVIHLSSKWIEKVKFRARLKSPNLTVPQIEKACNSSDTGKKKIGQILLSVYQAVSVKVPLSDEFVQQIRAWTEAEQKPEHKIGKNPAAQRLIKAMEKPPYLTDEDIDALNQSIKEGKIPMKFDSPFETAESEKNE